MNNDYSVVILAAGNSSRMGKSKLILKCNNNKTFIENISDQYYKFGCKQIIIVLNSEGSGIINVNNITLTDKSEIAINNHPELGRFNSIKIGMQHVKSNKCFVHNIDNPFANIKVLKNLSNSISGYDIAKPVYNGKGGHPILISKKVIEKINYETNINFNFKDYIKPFSSTEVFINDNTILFNINTLDEYQDFLRNN